MFKFYLAHPFDSRKEIRKWELKVEAKTGVTLINPFYDSERCDVVEMDAGRSTRYQVDPKEIVENDTKLIRESDGIVAIIDGQVSYGTIMEIVYASMYNKVIYIVVSNGHIQHPWLQYHGTRLFESLGDMEKFLKKEAPADEGS